jgi:antitoxin component YwqK of YwqJK toxin-antitoxin module
MEIKYKILVISNLVKKFFYVFLILLVKSCSSSVEVNCSDLSEENGLLKLNNEKFSGSCFTYFEDNPSLLDEKRSYKNGLMHGNWTKNHNNGNLFYSSYAKKGEINGKYASYHPNGNLADKGKMKKGYKDGVWEYYGINGVLYKKELYKNKNLTDEEYY